VAVHSTRASGPGELAGDPSRAVLEAHETQTDIAQAWRRILATVRTYADLEPTLLASVEELIDFVTANPVHQ